MSAGGGGEPLYHAGLGYPQASLSGPDRAGQGRGRARRGKTGQDKTGEEDYVWSYSCTSCHLAGQSRRGGHGHGHGHIITPLTWLSCRDLSLPIHQQPWPLVTYAVSAVYRRSAAQAARGPAMADDV
jgi:hypothetical protein